MGSVKFKETVPLNNFPADSEAWPSKTISVEDRSILSSFVL